MVSKNTKELRRFGIRSKVLKRRLGPMLSKSMNKAIKVQRVGDIKILDARSMNFDVARLTVEYKQDDKDKELRLIRKSLKPDYPGTDFSHIHTRIHREREDLPEYTKKLFESFPLLYRGRFKSISENLMPFGFECNNGWFKIIWNLSKNIAKEYSLLLRHFRKYRELNCP